MPAYLMTTRTPAGAGNRRHAPPLGRPIRASAQMLVVLVASLLAACSADGGASPTAEPREAPSPTAGPTDAVERTLAPETPVPGLPVDETLLQPAPPVSIADASTEFDDPAELEGWRVSQGEAMDGGTTTFTVADGVLRIEAAQSEWIDREHGASAGRTIEGNLVVTIRIRSTGVGGGLPAVPWSLAGVMLRAPTSDPASENWVHWSAGALSGPTLERKDTRGGRSELAVIRVPEGWVELRVLRHGRSVVLLHRSEGGAWMVDHTYDRPDFPDGLEVLLTTQTGGESNRGDLVAAFDWIHVAASPVSPGTGDTLDSGHAVDPATLLAELGD